MADLIRQLGLVFSASSLLLACSSEPGSGSSSAASALAGGGRSSSPVSSAAMLPGAPGNRPLRPGDLLDAPARFLGRAVEVDIVEPLSGPLTPAALATADYGQVRIEMPDSRGNDLALVPLTYRPDDPNRYRSKFDRVIDGPVRVRGEFLSDDDLARQSHKPAYVIRVTSVEPLAREPAAAVSSLAVLEADRARWDRKHIVYEGVLVSGFEKSALDGKIWLDYARDLQTIGEPAGSVRNTADRVRATGILFAKVGESYGHLAGYGFELHASKIEYLGPAPGK